MASLRIGILAGGLGTRLGAAAYSSLDEALAKKAVSTAPDELFAFGNAARPRPPRLADMELSENGLVIAQTQENPIGASTTIDPEMARLRGHYHSIAEGTPMPSGLGVVRDGSDIGGERGPGHATIYPTETMAPDRFRELFLGLPWQHAGRIK